MPSRLPARSRRRHVTNAGQRPHARPVPAQGPPHRPRKGALQRRATARSPTRRLPHRAGRLLRPQPREYPGSRRRQLPPDRRRDGCDAARTVHCRSEDAVRARHRHGGNAMRRQPPGRHASGGPGLRRPVGARRHRQREMDWGAPRRRAARGRHRCGRYAPRGLREPRPDRGHGHAFRRLDPARQGAGPPIRWSPSQ